MDYRRRAKEAVAAAPLGMSGTYHPALVMDGVGPQARRSTRRLDADVWITGSPSSGNIHLYGIVYMEVRA